MSVVLYGEEENSNLAFSRLYPLAVEPASNEELLDFQIMASNYTGGETVNVAPYCSRVMADGTEFNQTLYFWGLLCYAKERIDDGTGEVQQKVGTVFRLGTATEPGETYLSFESVAAVSFIKRSLFPLMQRGMIGIGDWPICLSVRIWEKPLPKGHTYRFKLLRQGEK